MFLSVASMAGTIWSKAWPLLVAVLFFSFVIMVHELGHFIFAKLFKVRVNKFALGMGPALIKFGKKETSYSLRLFPIGGYCAMEGEDEESDDERSFSAKPVWQRFIIVSMGALLNILLGAIIIAVMLTQENLIGTSTVHSFPEGSAVQEAGMCVGDKIVAINGKRIFSDVDIGFLLMRDKDSVVDFTLKRGKEKVELTDVDLSKSDENGNKSIKMDFIIKGVKPSFLPVIKYSALQTVSMGRMVWLGLFDLITGQFGFKDISGPIGVVSFIAQAAEESRKTDFLPLLNLMALISINIGIFNLLPIPALDGGRLFFMFVEMIRRKPVPQKYESWIHAAGLILLLIFMAVVSLKDIIYLFK
ncbi:MAG: M50 family metallopeptidase [Acutalibacteraceae bacterium]|jgi:regulator of sigma E protease